MPPTLKVLLPSPTSPTPGYPPTNPMTVNSSKPTRIQNENFDGEMSLWIKDYKGVRRMGGGEEYFGEEGRGGMSYAIVVRGRYLKPISANDLLFGNVFEKPIRNSLPWGTSIAMKFVNWVDPTVEMEPYSDKPWALAPLLASMHYLSIHPSSASTTFPSKEGSDPRVLEKSYEGIRRLVREKEGRGKNVNGNGNESGKGKIGNHKEGASATASTKASTATSSTTTSTPSSSTDPSSNSASDSDDDEDEDEDLPSDPPAWEDDSPAGIAARRKWLRAKENREKVMLGPETVVEGEFANGLINFNNLEVVLPQPFPLRVPLLKYWDGQPAIYICKSRDGKTVFWSVAVQIHEREEGHGEGTEREWGKEVEEGWEENRKGGGKEQEGKGEEVVVGKEEGGKVSSDDVD